MTEEMTFAAYIRTLQQFLAENPEAADMKVFIGNGYCTSEEYVQLRRGPHIRPLLGRAAKKHLGDIVMLL
jgi:hypothetical protein